MLNVLQKLARDYPDIVKIAKAVSVPYQEYKQMMYGSDILLDQLYSYTPGMERIDRHGERTGRYRRRRTGNVRSYGRTRKQTYYQCFTGRTGYLPKSRIIDNASGIVRTTIFKQSSFRRKTS